MRTVNKMMSIFLMITLGWTMIACTDDLPADKIDKSTLSEQEEASLIFMREEEKLARDVYLKMYAKYNFNIFQNIAGSEQKHMDFVLEIIEYYGLDDISSPDEGVFVNPDLQGLYHELVAKGNESFDAALEVGATIEDLDIVDLQHAISETDKSNITDLYNLLQCGSRNHLRAFVGQINQNENTYVPQFMSVAQYNEIIGGSHENCGG